MIKIRLAEKAEYKLVRRFYIENNYNNKVRQKDSLIIALDDNEIVGCVRLCNEYKKILLRGMWVTKDYQGKGVGTMILNEFSKLTQGKECYCLPYIHLEDFYSKIGFKKIDNKHAPLFLQNRLERYKNIEKFTLMIMKKD